MNPVLFILMRTDLDSMGSGKAMAQAVHAGNALETHFESLTQEPNNNTADPSIYRLSIEFQEWKQQTPQGFGTTIVLGGSMAQIKTDIEWLNLHGFLAGVVHDPTYPLKDGSVTHLIPLDTCAYIFAPDKDDPYLRIVLNKYELHP
jgi:peptidyl-tRNA hydrolase